MNTFIFIFYKIFNYLIYNWLQDGGGDGDVRRSGLSSWGALEADIRRSDDDSSSSRSRRSSNYDDNQPDFADRTP